MAKISDRCAGRGSPRSDFLISVENDLAHFGVSGELVNQARMGFGQGTPDGAGVQSVTVTIPQCASATMFGRLKVLQP